MFTNKLAIVSNGPTTKVDQIVDCMKKDIEAGKLKRNDRLPSINDLSKKYRVSRETIEKAYRELQRQSLIYPVAGKGNFVSASMAASKHVLMILDDFDSYNKEVYSTFIVALGRDVKVDLQIYHGNMTLLSEIIASSQKRYDYYVVSPKDSNEFTHPEFQYVLTNIPENQIVILDQKLDRHDFMGINIYQDMADDIFQALSHQQSLLSRYKDIALVIPDSARYCSEIVEGVKSFSISYSKRFSRIYSSESIRLKPGVIYMVPDESYSADITRKLRRVKLEPGRDVGVICFRESVLNELIGITVITSDYELMGETAAQLILNKQASMLRNGYKFIRRTSL